jgi:hypothetical protein
VSALPSRDAFVESVNTSFAARSDAQPVFMLELVSVTSQVSSETQESFSLMFRAPVDAPSVQGTYRLEHQTLPGMDIFLVPVKRDDNGISFEAVFNHLLARS